MPTWLQIVITAVVIPGAGYSLKVLYGVGQVMGKNNGGSYGNIESYPRLLTSERD